jgi:hypothetical protein
MYYLKNLLLKKVKVTDKYLAFAMVGLEVWVRPEAAVPLFCALVLTELLFVYRNNKAQLLNIAKIVFVILISLLPFFINNTLLFEFHHAN